MRLIAHILPLACSAYGVLATAILTNWFRYPFSLETGVVAVVAGIVSGLCILCLLRLRSQPTNAGRLRLSILVASAGIVLIGSSMLNTTGSVLPPWKISHIERSAEQVFQDDAGSRLAFHLEIENPFASSRSAVLVVRRDGTETRIELPLFHEKPAAVVLSNSPRDWASLERGPESSTYYLHTTSHLREATFLIDLPRATAQEIIDSTGESSSRF